MMEPVAWRLRWVYPATGQPTSWIATTDKSVADQKERDGLEVEPLVPASRLSDAEARIEAERLRFEGDLDKWMKTIGAGISGYQPEAYAVMDAACDELVRLRDRAEAAEALLKEALEVFDTYADPTGYIDGYGEAMEADAMNRDEFFKAANGLCMDAAIEIDRLTRELAEAQKDRDYWKVEAEGERAKVERRDKQLDRIAASIAEQVMIMDGEKCRLIIGFETPAKTQEAFDVLGEATGMIKVTPPANALKEKP